MELSSGYRQRQRGCAAGSVSVDDDTVGGDDKCLSVDCIADDDQRPAEPSAGEDFVVCVVFRAECIEHNTDIQRWPVSGSVCGIRRDVAWQPIHVAKQQRAAKLCDKPDSVCRIVKRVSPVSGSSKQQQRGRAAGSASHDLGTDCGDDMDQRLARVDRDRRGTARRCSNSDSAGGAVQRA